jgi:hypothetical protein
VLTLTLRLLAATLLAGMLGLASAQASQAPADPWPRQIQLSNAVA